jgi:anaerobic magnesium-protoporphyrin IX monomethyl ester cyclase
MATIIFLIQREEIDPSRMVYRKILFPVESAFSAAKLMDMGHQVSAFDLNLQESGLAWTSAFEELIQDTGADVVVSAPQMLTFLITEDRNDTRAAFEVAKSAAPSIVTVYCGPYATSYPQEAMKEVNSDFLIRGEYDEALALLVGQIESRDSIVTIHGVMSSANPNRIPAPVYVRDLDSVPFPAYTEFGVEKYFLHRGQGNLRYAEHSSRYTHYLSSRGCVGRCCFCNVAFLRGTRRYRVRSTPQVIDDLSRLVQKYGIEEIHFLDENLNLRRSRIQELSRGILGLGTPLSWIGASGMNIYTLDRETLEMMREAGCYRLNLAIESGSEEVLKRIIRKPVNLNKATKTLEIARDLDFEIIGYFVVGLPGETRDQINETIAFAGLPFFDYVTFSIATPQVGTPLADLCKQEGLITAGDSLADIKRRATGVFSTSEFSQSSLERIRWQEWDRINFGTDYKISKACRIMGISPEELTLIRSMTRDSFVKRWGLRTDLQGAYV